MRYIQIGLVNAISKEVHFHFGPLSDVIELAEMRYNNRTTVNNGTCRLSQLSDPLAV